MDNNPQSIMGISLYAHFHNLNNHIILMGSYNYYVDMGFFNEKLEV